MPEPIEPTEPPAELRADASRTVARLQNRIGELVGQQEQLADIIDQLQERLREEVAVRVKAETELAQLKVKGAKT